MARKLRREAPALLDRVDKHLSVVTVLEGIYQKLRNRCERARAKHDVHVGNLLLECFAVTLSDAAAYGNDAPSAGRLRQPHQVRSLAVQVRVRLLAHRARHEHDDVRLGDVAYLDATAVVQKTRNPFRVMQVHLASERADVVGFTDKLWNVRQARPTPLFRGATTPCEPRGRGGGRRPLCGLPSCCHR